MVAEHKGGGHGEGHVQDLALGVHLAHDVEHGDVVGQGSHQTGGALVIHAQGAAQLGQGAAEGTGDPLHHGEGADQNNADLAADQQAVVQRSHAQVGIHRGHHIEHGEHDAGDLLEHGDGSQDGDDHGDAGAELVEAVDHGTGGEPQADDDQGGDDDDGHQINQDAADVHLIGGHVHDQAAHDAADGDGDHTGQDAGAQVGAVFLLDDAQGHRDGKHDGGAHHGAQDQAGEVTDGGVAGQLHSQRVAAHVAGQNGGGEHRGIGADGGVDGGDDGAQHHGQHGGRRIHAGHGDGQAADGVEAVLKLLAVAQLIAADTVNGAHNHEDHHDQHDDGVDVQSGNPGFDTLSKNTGVSSCDQFAKIHYLHSFSNSQNSLGVEGLSSLCAYSRDWNTCCAGRGMTEVPTSSSASRDAAATASRTAPTSPVRVTKPLPPMA